MWRTSGLKFGTIFEIVICAGHFLCFWGALGCCILMLLGNLSKSWVSECPNYAFMAYNANKNSRRWTLFSLERGELKQSKNRFWMKLEVDFKRNWKSVSKETKILFHKKLNCHAFLLMQSLYIRVGCCSYWCCITFSNGCIRYCGVNESLVV